MELPDIGSHCAFDGCSRLDFLVVSCKFCQKQFCPEHGNIVTHRCPCVPESGGPSVSTKGNVPITTYIRPDRGSATPVHNDTKKELSAEQAQALRQFKDANQGDKAAATKQPARPPRKSPKIELMRLKAKATGNASIDMNDRLYLCIEHKEKSISVFISKRSVVGNSATQFAKQMRLSLLPGKVYRLHKPGADEPLPSNKPFEGLLSGSDEGICNGCTLELRDTSIDNKANQSAHASLRF